ncbi:MAG TPA: hypothetical protein VMT03_05750 [Polyangia bacterium]|nr:hypothetical protein [Polyangia bacterium]
MTSNLRKTLQAALAVVAVVWSAAEARAQDLETPDSSKGAAAAPASTASAAPTGFGDAGQWLLSVENLFGYTYAHQSNNLTVNTFTLLGDSLGSQKSMYDWPRLALDTMLAKSISLGLAGSFARYSTSVPATVGVSSSRFQYEASLRAGYVLNLGQKLDFWPRVGVTYSYTSGNTAQSAVAATIDGLLVLLFAPNLAVTLGPVADVGLTGKIGNTNVTYLNIGVYFGLTIVL